MPPVSSVLENCVVGKEGGNESQPVGGLCERHRTRRAGKSNALHGILDVEYIKVRLEQYLKKSVLLCTYLTFL